MDWAAAATDHHLSHPQDQDNEINIRNGGFYFEHRSLCPSNSIAHTFARRTKRLCFRFPFRFPEFGWHLVKFIGNRHIYLPFYSISTLEIRIFTSTRHKE